ncbi:hypothetical protein MCOR25_007434 [Pyricularia grisea]|nr:hypothetical protein MCOR25_007434 [Pyricularia grisea]
MLARHIFKLRHQFRASSHFTTTRFVSKMTGTIPLYQRDESLRSHITKVTSVRPVSALSDENKLLFKQATAQDLVVVTAETIFYAQGGGQPYDTGVMRGSTGAEFRVTAVRNAVDGGEILHLGSFAGAKQFVDGEEAVEQVVDDARRTLHSRVHTAGHLVALAVRHMADSMPAPVVELGASHAPESAFVNFEGTIDGSCKDVVQRKVDEFVAAALPVKVYFWTEEELRARCATVPQAVVMPSDGGLVRAVDIEGAGAYPCGGTHVRDTGLVGRVTVKKISRSKGNSRVSYSIE